MHKATHEKLNSISLWLVALLALFGCLTTPFIHASAHVLTQPSSISSANNIQELEVTKVEDSTQAAKLNTLLHIKIRTGQRSDSSGTLSLLPSAILDNTMRSSYQQGDIRPIELCCASSK